MDTENVQMTESHIISEKLFEELDIDIRIKSALTDMNMKKMTPVQDQCIPHLLNGKDVQVAAKTGSGKTLAFLVPLVQKVLKSDFEPRHGTVAIIMSPTRELSLQIFTVLEKLVSHTKMKTGLIFGGKNRAIEAKHLQEGITILVATPGRLLDHLNNTKDFLFHRLETLIIDEADKLMEQGFFDDMKAIFRKLPKKRQTALFSATLKTNSKVKSNEDATNKKLSLDEKVSLLAFLGLKKNCVVIDVSKINLKNTNNQNLGNEGNATVSQLSQGFVICKPCDRFRVLYTLIKNLPNKKIIVFLSACMEVKYFYELFNMISIEVLALHGKQNQPKRLSNFEKFSQKESGIILCTDVAARGLDVPDVDWVIQFDPPDKSEDYIHRVGRTARAGKEGQALIFIRPEEVGFLHHLHQKQIPLDEMEFEDSMILPIQDNLETIVASNKYLKASAKLGLIAFVKTYQSYNKKFYNVNKLDLQALATSFGLKEPPVFHIDVSHKSKRKRTNEDDKYIPTKKTKPE